MHTHTHTHTCTYTSMHVHTTLHIHIIHTHMCTRTHKPGFTLTSIIHTPHAYAQFTHVHACLHIYTNTYNAHVTRAYVQLTHIHIKTGTHTLTCIHTQSFLQNSKAISKRKTLSLTPTQRPLNGGLGAAEAISSLWIRECWVVCLEDDLRQEERGQEGHLYGQLAQNNYRSKPLPGPRSECGKAPSPLHGLRVALEYRALSREAKTCRDSGGRLGACQWAQSRPGVCGRLP